MVMKEVSSMTARGPMADDMMVIKRRFAYKGGTRSIPLAVRNAQDSLDAANGTTNGAAYDRSNRARSIPASVRTVSDPAWHASLRICGRQRYDRTHKAAKGEPELSHNKLSLLICPSVRARPCEDTMGSVR
jgi:hypothetical protein